MKAVISSTYSDNYLFFLPLVTWCWNRLGIDVICFMPTLHGELNNKKIDLIIDCKWKKDLKLQWHSFVCPEHKESTYAQCSRLFASCLDLPDDECLVVSDVDMAVFGNEFNYLDDGRIHSVGYDLLDVETMKQIPMCYLAMQTKDWKKIMDVSHRTYQQCLDDLVGVIECEHFRGNQWSLDQFTAYSQFKKQGVHPIVHNRAKMPERFATKRYDRDDSFLIERLSLDTIDYHLPRPGFEENNFNQIITVLKFHYPNENFDWLVEYRKEYLRLL